ncbi:TrmH family RNA methyltransferase [Candidatus Microgenomates bacterium]|nr:TrmH family RNA methyltransferase [Candidatus Microgenomates bacterium]
MKKYKKDLDVSYAIGAYPTIELLLNRPKEVEHILISTRAERNTGVDKIIKICKDKHITTELADGAIQKISNSENCYAVGIFKKYKSPIQKGNHLVLVNPDDKGNLGANIRTMMAFSIRDLVIIRPAADVMDPKVVRASMGAVFKINTAYYGSFDEYNREFKNNVYPFMSDATTELKNAKFEAPFSLVFGNEGAGLGAGFRQIGTPVKIAQTSQVDSLNLSVAVGIGLYASSV